MEADPCCPVTDPPVFEAVDEGESVRESSSGSFGRRFFKSTNPEGAVLMGTYLLSSRNLIYFS